MSNVAKEIMEEKKTSRHVKNRKIFPMKLALRIASFAVIVGLFASLFLLTKSQVQRTEGGGMTPQSIKEIAEFASFEFRYCDVIELVEAHEFKLFGLWDINPGESILIVKYDGIIKLGIDSSEIQITELQPTEEGKTKVEVWLPEIKILSSERPQDSFEIVVNRGIYTKEKIGLEAFFEAAAQRQKEYDAMALQAYGDSARENAKKQFESLLRQFKVDEKYEIVWIN